MTTACRKPAPVSYTSAELTTLRRLRARRGASYLDQAAYQAATREEEALHRDCYRRYLAQEGIPEPQPGAAPAPKLVPAAKAGPKPAQPGDAASAKPARGDGVTARVYQWCLDHPDATKKDAVAAHPGVNPTTVGVQHGKARRVQ